MAYTSRHQAGVVAQAHNDVACQYF